MSMNFHLKRFHISRDTSEIVLDLLVRIWTTHDEHLVVFNVV